MPESRGRKAKGRSQGFRGQRRARPCSATAGLVPFQPSEATKQATYAAAEDDGTWFDEHPQASVRAREALPMEFTQALSHDHRRRPLSPNQRLTVIVVQTRQGRRIRIPYTIVTTDNHDEALSQQQLDAVLADWEAGDQRVPMTNPAGEMFDALKMFRLAMSGITPPDSDDFRVSVADLDLRPDRVYLTPIFDIMPV